MIRLLFFASLLIHSALAQKTQEKASKWKTLNGDEPIVIARGGFSGLFPESCQNGNALSVQTSLSNLVLFCNLQLTKEGVGICQTDLRLDNSTNISEIYPKSQNKYNVNGQDLQGWFPMDFTSDQLFNNVTLVQSLFSRTNMFDGQMPMSTVEDVLGIRDAKFWLNAQYVTFYNQHKLSVATYLQKAMRLMVGIHYLSSPEVEFLKSMNGKINKARTKLIFQFQAADAVEPSTKQKYSSLLKDLNSIKSFASGILVPKEYIWPVNKDRYLEAPTSLVADAHKLGLEVYASGFANDFLGSYNYSYNPVAEYLQFIDNSDFSVDGVLSDFPPTASEAIACFAQNKNVTKPTKGKPLIISHNGASGVYAGCTDLAYQKAVEDGADIIDCSVQMSKDGVAFCLDSADLTGDTDALTTFMSRSTVIPEIQNNSGIFSFDLTWTEIQTLKPQLISPMADSGFIRNPAMKNKGKFWTLAEFLDFANAKAVSGVLINIENAPYLASKKGVSITDVVAKALSNATLDKQSTQQVLIQSDDTSVLSQFKNVPTYKRVFLIREIISDVPKDTVAEIKKYADAINVLRASVVKITESFSTGNTKIIDEMHAANISIYVGVLRNEYVTIPFDFFSDPMVELATFTAGLRVDGVFTDYPATASAYLRSPCSDPNANIPYSILPAEPGSMLNGLVSKEIAPPESAPDPTLKVSDVVDPPLPPVANLTATSAPAPAGAADAADGGAAADAGTTKSSGLVNVANVGLSLVAIMVLSFLSWGSLV